MVTSYGIGHRCSSDLMFPWLWHRPIAAAPILPLAQELPSATGEPLKNKTKQNKTKRMLLAMILLYILLAYCSSH